MDLYELHLKCNPTDLFLKSPILPYFYVQGKFSQKSNNALFPSKFSARCPKFQTAELKKLATLPSRQAMICIMYFVDSCAVL